VRRAPVVRRFRRSPLPPVLALPLTLLVACGGDDRETVDTGADTVPTGAARADAPGVSAEQQQFWAALTELCDNAYEGTVVEAPADDTTFAGRRLVMHVRSCDGDVIRIPFHVGEDRSRTWVITRTSDGLRLKHDHRHEDGSEDEVTQYGGDTAGPGSAHVQEFPADAFTSELIPAAATNVWTVEVVPGEQFTYALRREGTDRRFRIEFDLTRTVDAPPAPWGAD
jgi:hypothetical protein